VTRKEPDQGVPGVGALVENAVETVSERVGGGAESGLWKTFPSVLVIHKIKKRKYL
jgi:hypothetical protein